MRSAQILAGQGKLDEALKYGEAALAQARKVKFIFTVIGMLIAVALVVTVAVMNPLPPRTIVMATGAQGGAYAEVARRYQAALARHGLNVADVQDLIATAIGGSGLAAASFNVFTRS